MKKIATIVFAALSAGYVAQANAATIAPADPGVPTTVDQTGANGCAMVSPTATFIVTPSKNVGLNYVCNATEIAVNAGNIKGKYAYGGSSAGGSVAQCATGTTPLPVSPTNGYAITPVLSTATVPATGCI